MDFLPFPKLTRLNKYSQHCTITEKIDGSNAQIVITDWQASGSLENVIVSTNGYHVRAGSRTRWITPGKETDNYGFAAWVRDNAEELIEGLGYGQHFGEWYGGKIQCGYGRSDKRFALFNTDRWGPHNPNTPECCEVVPVLHTGEYSPFVVDAVMEHLAKSGSRLVPGFMRPEGIVVYLRGPRIMLKKTFDNDIGKWAAAA